MFLPRSTSVRYLVVFDCDEARYGDGRDIHSSTSRLLDVSTLSVIR